jgi:hypothetical protein
MVELVCVKQPQASGKKAPDVAQAAAHWLSANDKKTLASAAVEAPAWMKPTLDLITKAVVTGIDG